MRVTINIPSDDINRLDDFATSRNIPRSELIRRIIKNYLSYQKPVVRRLHKDMFGKFADLFDAGRDSLNKRSPQQATGLKQHQLFIFM